jgi:hypothetical protein
MARGMCVCMPATSREQLYASVCLLELTGANRSSAHLNIDSAKEGRPLKSAQSVLTLPVHGIGRLTDCMPVLSHAIISVGCPLTAYNEL